MRKYTLNKALDKCVDAYIRQIFDKKSNEDIRINRLFREDWISKEDLLDEIHDMFDETIIDAALGNRDLVLKKLDENAPILRQQIESIVTYVTTKYIWKPFQGLQRTPLKPEERITYISKNKFFIKFDEHEIAKTVLTGISRDQYHLERTIRERFFRL